MKEKLFAAKVLFKDDQLAALDTTKHIMSLLPTNISVKCCYAKMISQSDSSFAAIKLLNSWLQQKPFEGQLWLTKAKIYEKEKHLMEAIRCYALFVDFPTENYVQYTKNPLFLKAYRRLFQLFKRCKVWTGALNIWETSNEIRDSL